MIKNYSNWSDTSKKTSLKKSLKEKCALFPWEMFFKKMIRNREKNLVFAGESRGWQSLVGLHIHSESREEH